MEGARPAIAADLARLEELWAVAFAEIGGQERGGRVFTTREAGGRSIEEWLADTESSVVIAGTVDDVVVGFATARTETLRDGAPHGVIEALFVESGARGVGVGEAMMGALLGWFRERGVVGVDAMALPGMRDTKNFFEAHGFTARLLVVHRRLTDA